MSESRVNKYTEIGDYQPEINKSKAPTPETRPLTPVGG